MIPHLTKPTCPVVGIGASAGALDAIEHFLRNVPLNSGIAFVVVQHLSPNDRELLVELLAKVTSLPIAQIANGMKVEVNKVYVIPPDRDLTMSGDYFQLVAPTAPRGFRAPVDFFFRSLAHNRTTEAIAVVLSGMGADGRHGLQEVKDHGGCVFAQKPESAQFKSMPQEAIDSGLVDIVADAEEMPEKIIQYLQHRRSLSSPENKEGGEHISKVDEILKVIRKKTGQDFSIYKRNTILRRLERRMAIHQISNLEQYHAYLLRNEQEASLLFKELLIGVTNFFRDSAVWEHLKTSVIPELLRNRNNDSVIRVWATACSTGEEAYSFAMIFREALDALGPEKHYQLQLFATDLNKEAISVARNGAYSAKIGMDVSEERLNRFFTPNAQGGFAIRREIREQVIFAPHNIATDPPFTKVDFVLCRNLLIYLDSKFQSKLIGIFHYSLNRGGYLVLGNAETAGTDTDLFSAHPFPLRIYRRKEDRFRLDPKDFPTGFSAKQIAPITTKAMPEQDPLSNVQELTNRFLVQRYAPSAVLVSRAGDILYLSGRTGKYLEPAVGKANLNLFAMCRPGLGEALQSGFEKAVEDSCEVKLKDVQIGTNGGAISVDIVICPTSDQKETVLVIFTDTMDIPVTESPGSQPETLLEHRMKEMSSELLQARLMVKSTRDEAQNALEELRSANEEYQSVNEELQSTNEELTTSKEELQSMNEELQTLNQELQSKVNELSRTRDDMKNLLDSTEIAILFLDGDFLIRRFTNRTKAIIKLIPTDIGRPLSDVSTTLQYPALEEDAREVLRSLVVCERQVPTRDGLYFSIRIIPYRTQDNRIDGVVITFTDITLSKELEGALRKAQIDLEGRLTIRDGAQGPGT